MKFFCPACGNALKKGIRNHATGLFYCNQCVKSIQVQGIELFQVDGHFMNWPANFCPCCGDLLKEDFLLLDGTRFCNECGLEKVSGAIGPPPNSVEFKGSRGYKDETSPWQEMAVRLLEDAND